jgi:hypothetical protein
MYLERGIMQQSMTKLKIYWKLLPAAAAVSLLPLKIIILNVIYHRNAKR